MVPALRQIFYATVFGSKHRDGATIKVVNIRMLIVFLKREEETFFMLSVKL